MRWIKLFENFNTSEKVDAVHFIIFSWAINKYLYDSGFYVINTKRGTESSIFNGFWPYGWVKNNSFTNSLWEDPGYWLDGTCPPFVRDLLFIEKGKNFRLGSSGESYYRAQSIVAKEFVRKNKPKK